MNFQVTPFPSHDKVALFQPRLEDLLRLPADSQTPSVFQQHEVVAVMSTASGHFPLVLHGEELVTIRDVCRKNQCECAGIFDRQSVPAQIEERLERVRQRTTHRIMF